MRFSANEFEKSIDHLRQLTLFSPRETTKEKPGKHLSFESEFSCWKRALQFPQLGLVSARDGSWARTRFTARLIRAIVCMDAIVRMWVGRVVSRGG